mgnify:CR=1 FL=1
MIADPHDLTNDVHTLPQMPSWITRGSGEAVEDVAFLSGAALSHLHLVLQRKDVPQALVRARRALRAAEACVALAGRSERAGDLRDAVAFVQPGDSPGPAGEVYLSWVRAVERPVSGKALQRALPGLETREIALWLDGSGSAGTAVQGGPLARAADVLAAVLADRPRDRVAALLLADASLAQGLRWSHVVPLLSIGLKRRDLTLSGDGLRHACFEAVTRASVEVVREAADLARRATRLRPVIPKLRAKGAEAAAMLLLERDALAPTALTSLRSDRARRRFCDRLVELGVVRELTGRDTFRLYGL